MGVRGDFEATLGFGIDDFQREAFDHLDAGRNVLVSAPTGSGKTLVATYAIELALASGVRSFYTTPLKALSNQKFHELGRRWGTENVGLLTGDTSINRDAPIVVMTTEVLRNMLLADAGRLPEVGLVVLDEVHFLQDPFRGGVWEEVLILAPSHVRFVALSATIANATTVGQWLTGIRGTTAVIVTTERPITLHAHVALTRRGQTSPELFDLLEGSRLSEPARRLDGQMKNTRRFRTGGHWKGSRPAGPPPPALSPRRSPLLSTMDQEDLLPAIVFIFSRAACDDAVRQCRKDGLRFTDRDQARRIRDIAYDRVADFRDEDLTALAFEEFLDSLMVGLAAHHAGMVPAFREIVEQCFEENLLGAVFATETLALGINMPARSVVLERMSKYSDAGRAMLNASEFLQMTGRAGRRGLDDEGHVVVCFAPETSMLDIGRLAVADPPDLHSSFRPTYNLTVNLLHHFDQATALDLIQRSFAQFEANLRPAGARRPLGDLLEARRSVLEALGYARGWSLSEGGQQLRSLYHENDLLLAEAWRSGVFEGCEPATLAAVLSAFVYEGRRRNTTGPVKATKRPKQKSVNDRLGPQRRLDIAERLQVLHSLHARVSEAENAFHVKHAKDPDGGLAAAMAAWARGATLHVTLDVADAELGFLAPGDFVRHAKQVGDLAEQIGRLDGGREWQSITQETRSAVVRSIVLGATEIRS